MTKGLIAYIYQVSNNVRHCLFLHAHASLRHKVGVMLALKTVVEEAGPEIQSAQG